MTLLADSSVLEIEGEQVLLLHGDLLCTDDLPYQRFRSETHTPAWQRAFLSRSVEERRAFAANARAESTRYTRAASESLMDVNPNAVASARGHLNATKYEWLPSVRGECFNRSTRCGVANAGKCH